MNVFRLYFLFLLPIFIGCSSPQGGGDSVSAMPFHTMHGEAQGTTYMVKYAFDDTIAKAQIDSILRRFDLSLSAWVDESVLSHFNSTDSLVIEDQLFLSAFFRGREISRLTGGSFHPMVMPLVRAWGFGPEGSTLREGVALDSLMALVTYDFTVIPADSSGETEAYLFVKPSGIQLDVNAYAQGLSVDVVADYLRDKGIRNFMVEIGGEVYAAGKNEKGEYWKIGVDKPVSLEHERQLQAIITLKNAALATSGSYRKFYMLDGKKYSHTIDPETGKPVTHNLLSATVMADNCTDADAYATAFMVMGVEGAKAFLERHPEAGLEAYLIYDTREGLQTFTSRGWKEAVEEL